MFRSDYVILATAFKSTRPNVDTVYAYSKEWYQMKQWEKDLIAIEKLFEQNNPRFDRVKFRRLAYSD